MINFTSTIYPRHIKMVNFTQKIEDLWENDGIIVWNCARIRVTGGGKFWLFDKHHYVYIHMWTHACVYICVRVRVYVHMYVCVFIYVCIYIVIYTYIYIQIRVCVCVYLYMKIGVWDLQYERIHSIDDHPPGKICQILEKICQDLALRLRRSMMATKKYQCGWKINQHLYGYGSIPIDTYF